MSCPVKRSLIKQKSSSAINIRCPAKINLYLNIVGKYPGGFHKIESIINRISLSDILTVRVKETPSITIECNDKSLENDENLCVKAALLIQKKCKLRCGFSLYLIKHIPVGAGLGGGSSCAASTLLAINELLNLKLSQERLYALGRNLGSDVNFFLSQSSYAYVRGRGENVLPLSIKSNFRYCILYPQEILLTQRVYENTKVKLTKFLNNVNIILCALKRKDIELLEWNVFNVLEKGGFLSSPRLKRYRHFLKKSGFRMTGSGSAFFSFINDKREVNTFKRRVPKNWGLFGTQSF